MSVTCYEWPQWVEAGPCDRKIDGAASGVLDNLFAAPGKPAVNAAHRTPSRRSPNDLVRTDIVGQDRKASLDRLKRDPAIALEQFAGTRG